MSHAPTVNATRGLSKAERVRRRAEYQRVYDQGTKIHSPLFTLFVLANASPAGRLGIAATRKLGGAVVRNRAKRLIREVFRRNKFAQGFDLVVVPKRDLIKTDLSTLETEFRHAFERSLRRRR